MKRRTIRKTLKRFRERYGFDVQDVSPEFYTIDWFKQHRRVRHVWQACRIVMGFVMEDAYNRYYGY